MVYFKRVELESMSEPVASKPIIELLQALQRYLLMNTWETSIHTESKVLSNEGRL